MRTVSACACARVQSRLSTAAVAAEFFNSVLREVGMAFLPRLNRRFATGFFCCLAKYLEDASESQHAARCQRMSSLVNPFAGATAEMGRAHLFSRLGESDRWRRSRPNSGTWRLFSC